jgi:hypothetical protein
MSGKRIYLFFLLLALTLLPHLSPTSIAQSNSLEMGFKLGVFFNIGTHNQSLGVKFNGYFTQSFVQLNVENSLGFSRNNMGKRKNLIQNRLATGVGFLGGTKTIEKDYILSDLRNVSNYSNSFSYSYIWYRDNKQTSQFAGAFGLQFNSTRIELENDFFAGFGRDRFRTGHIRAVYFNGIQQYTMGIKIWTGETRGSNWIKTPSEKRPNGYRNLEALPYGKTSHGIFYIGAYQLIDPNFYGGIEFGVDAEQVRNILQNRLSHDLIFLPKKMKRNTPHYPMLDNTGRAVQNKEDVRRIRLYLQGKINDDNMY